MLVTRGDLPANEAAFAFEVKWDGFRALVYLESGSLRVESRNGFDLTARCPELAGLGGAIGGDAVLDGELVVLGADGRPWFDGVRRRLLLGQGSAPLVFVAFDVLWLAGRPLIDRPYEERRATLESLALAGPHWQVCPSYVGAGSALFEATRTQGLEGIVAKRLGSPYRPGVRVRSWRKVKHWRRAAFWVGGFSPPVPERDIPAGLLVGTRVAGGGLRFAARVEFGFARGELEALRSALPATSQNPFVDYRGRPGTAFGEPGLEVDIQFLDHDDHGRLRHASYKGVHLPPPGPVA